AAGSSLNRLSPDSARSIRLRLFGIDRPDSRVRDPRSYCSPQDGLTPDVTIFLRSHRPAYRLPTPVRPGQRCGTERVVRYPTQDSPGESHLSRGCHLSVPAVQIIVLTRGVAVRRAGPPETAPARRTNGT